MNFRFMFYFHNRFIPRFPHNILLMRSNVSIIVWTFFCNSNYVLNSCKSAQITAIWFGKFQYNIHAHRYYRLRTKYITLLQYGTPINSK